MGSNIETGYQRLLNVEEKALSLQIEEGDVASPSGLPTFWKSVWTRWQLPEKFWRLYLKRIALGLFICLSVAVTVVSIVFRQTLVQTLFGEARWEDCGGTPTEAIRRGCTFELLTFGWQTKECHNADLEAEFRSYDWTWYTDASGRVEVPVDVVLRGDTNYYVTQRYHRRHCAYSLRMLHDGWQRGYIEDEQKNYTHTVHCTSFMTDESMRLNDIHTLIRVYYPRCNKV